MSDGKPKIIRRGPTLELQRFASPAAVAGTPGEFTLYDREDAVLVLKTLELPWKENQTDISCIPAGEYELKRRTSGQFAGRANARWGHHWGVQIAGVEGRVNVLIHWGNYLRNTQGCVLTGLVAAQKGGEHVVWQSVAAYRKLYRALLDLGGPDETRLIVKDAEQSEGEEDLNTDRSDI